MNYRQPGRIVVTLIGVTIADIYGTAFPEGKVGRRYEPQGILPEAFIYQANVWPWQSASPPPSLTNVYSP